MLIEIDAIQGVSGIEITPTVEVQFGRKHELCVAITIEELDFNATFNHKEKDWNARWKWTRNRAPDQLPNLS